MKLMTFVGTRPELIRLSATIARCDEVFKHALVHTGQNYDYELNQVFFEDLEIREPDFYLGCAASSPAATIAGVIAKADELFEDIKPDAVLILGDTNSAMVALPAKRRQIPIFHMEAGNRSFDLRVPEEINRKVVDHLSDINLPYSDIARSYLLREGIPPDSVIVTGSPMREVLHRQRQKIDRSNVLKEQSVSPNEYFLVSCHRQENVDSEQRLQALASVVNWLASTYALPIIFSCHPRTRDRLTRFGVSFDATVQLMKPFSFSDYIKLQQNAKVVLSDSGTITEEASILNFKALNIRQAHERPEGMEEGAVMMVDFDIAEVSTAMTILDSQTNDDESRYINLVSDYRSLNVSEKVVRIILSYTGFVRRVNWRDFS